MGDEEVGIVAEATALGACQEPLGFMQAEIGAAAPASPHSWVGGGAVALRARLLCTGVVLG